MNNSDNREKKIHFIGICGVAMSALAIAFKNLGYKVTGSDKGFYPPVSDNLKKAKINFYPGWHPKKMIENGLPDIVVVGNVAGSQNPELLYIKENNILYKSYPEIISEFLITKNSIVCAGTYGKSTSSALMTWIIKNTGKRVNHMFGGISLNNLEPAQIEDGAEWSIVEGDEYKTSQTDSSAKFEHYSTTHLLLTSISWDHADVYPTEKSYIDTFINLVNSIPENGISIISEKAINVIEKYINKNNDPSIKQSKIISYGKNVKNDFVYSNIIQTKEKLSFIITNKAKVYNISAPILGEYNADNITGCFALACAIGLDEEKIIKAIASFKGMKRRLEKRFEEKITILDDIAHSPDKARAVLNSLKKIYNGKIIAVFEPNTGNRRPQSSLGYSGAFSDADEIIIPRLTKLKIDPNNPIPPMEGDDLIKLIPNSKYIDNDEKLVNYLVEKIYPEDVVVFLGSHSFRNMIEEIIIKLKNNNKV